MNKFQLQEMFTIKLESMLEQNLGSITVDTREVRKELERIRVIAATFLVVHILFCGIVSGAILYWMFNGG